MSAFKGVLKTTNPINRQPYEGKEFYNKEFKK